MMDYFNLPNTENNFKVFYSNNGDTWQTWQKPRNTQFINFFLVGGGGGGAGGSSGGISSGAGGGGGSSSITTALFPASVLPDTLYILVGRGGLGNTGETSSATSGGPGQAGTLSYVSVVPSATTSITNTNPIILASGNAANITGYQGFQCIWFVLALSPSLGEYHKEEGS